MDFEEWAKGFMEKLRPAAEGAQERQPKVPKYVSLHNVVGVCGVCWCAGFAHAWGARTCRPLFASDDPYVSGAGHPMSVVRS